MINSLVLWDEYIHRVWMSELARHDLLWVMLCHTSAALPLRVIPCHHDWWPATTSAVLPLRVMPCHYELCTATARTAMLQLVLLCHCSCCPTTARAALPQLVLFYNSSCCPATARAAPPLLVLPCHCEVKGRRKCAAGAAVQGKH